MFCLLPWHASALLTSGKQPYGVPRIVFGNTICRWNNPEQTPLLAELYCHLFLVELLYIRLLCVSHKSVACRQTLQEERLLCVLAKVLGVSYLHVPSMTCLHLISIMSQTVFRVDTETERKVGLSLSFLLASWHMGAYNELRRTLLARILQF